MAKSSSRLRIAGHDYSNVCVINDIDGGLINYPPVLYEAINFRRKFVSSDQVQGLTESRVTNFRA